MNYQEGMRHFEREDLSLCYLLSGEEPLLLSRLLHRLLEKGIEPSLAAFNSHQFRGESISPEAVVSMANTFPVSSPRRVIVIRNAEHIKDEAGLLLHYLNDPCETSLLVFVSEKPDMRKKLFSTLKRLATVMACPRLYDRELPAWIAQEGSKNGLRFSQEALWLIKEYLGNDLSLIQREIEKIGLYLARVDSTSEGEALEVSSEVVRVVVSGGRSHSIFELLRALGEKDRSKALRLLNLLLGEGAHPLFILSMLTRQLRQMSLARTGIDAGLKEAVIAKKVPMPPGLFQRFLKQVEAWSQAEIRSAFAGSLSADSQLKGGSLSPAIVLETLLLDLCQGNSTFPRRAAYLMSFQEQTAF